MTTVHECLDKALEWNHFTCLSSASAWIHLENTGRYTTVGQTIFISQKIPFFSFLTF